MVKKSKKIQIIAAMSGGVDSSVAAALLKQRGFEVRGIYMRLFDEPQNRVEQYVESRGKNYESGEKYARDVAKKLGIKLKVLDLRKKFKKYVIDYFLSEFKAGRTPNPCVVCNQEIKFGLLLDKAVEMGGDYVVTGHYARINSRELKTQSAKLKTTALNCQAITAKWLENSKLYRLLTAKDKTKDQSYFLYNLTQDKLAKILFPLGSYKKSEIYKMAEKRQLPYKKGESMDICFVGKRGHREFLRNNLGVKKGKIVDVNGKILGEHQGIWFYTIGQRVDIGGPGPFFVVKIDAKKNAVVVSNKFRGEEFYKKELIAKNVNWVAGIEPKMSLKCRARIRYGQQPIAAEVKSQKSLIQKELQGAKRLVGKVKSHEVIFKNPQRAITPGQSVVFYRRNEVLGGGTIKT